jgi:predicted RNA-binding Zn-ribbon protein involved in translation (DUF1610 family)
MTVPHYINGHQSDIRAIKPGWYGVETNGKLSSGPYPNQGKCLSGITQARNNFRASPWVARATASSKFEHRPGLRTIKCPACGDEHVRPFIRVDEGSRESIDNSCESCGHKLSLEEGSRHVY